MKHKSKFYSNNALNLICGCEQAFLQSCRGQRILPSCIRKDPSDYLWSSLDLLRQPVQSSHVRNAWSQASRSVSSMARGGNRKLRYSFRRWNNQVWQCQISRYPKQQFELDQLPVQRKILAALRLHQQKIWISRCIRWPHNKTCVFKTKMWVW